MVFLTALALAKHRSELHAFSYRVQHPEDWFSVTLVLVPLFVVKTERASCPESHLHDVHLKALAPFVGPDLKVDANNCVVRAIKIYLAHAKDLHQGRKCLFIAYSPGHTEEIKAAAISSWIVKTERYAYKISPTTRRVTSKWELMMYGPSPPAGMPYSRFPCTTSYGQLSDALAPLSSPFTSRTSRWWKRTFWRLAASSQLSRSRIFTRLPMTLGLTLDSTDMAMFRTTLYTSRCLLRHPAAQVGFL